MPVISSFPKDSVDVIDQIIVAPSAPCGAEGCRTETAAGSVQTPQFIDLRPHGLNVAMARLRVTNRIYASSMEHVPSKELPYSGDPRFNASDNPAVGLRESDAAAYCEWLSKQLNLDITLPVVSLWESAA